MGLFKISVKQTQTLNGIKLEKGMSVEVVSSYTNPVTTNGGREVIEAFQRIYGIDIKKAGIVSNSYLEVKKIN